jgi:hypothetical protein
MEKELVYKYGDEYHDDEYSYYVDYGEVYELLEQLFAENYGLKKQVAKDIIDDLCLWDILEEVYEEDILDHWYLEAMEQQRDDKEYDADIYSYYGVSRNDF